MNSASNHNNDNNGVDTSSEWMGNNKRRRSSETAETDCWLIEDYDSDDEDSEDEQEEEELLQMLNNQLNNLAQSVTSLKRTNDKLANTLCDLHEENHELMASGNPSSPKNFDIVHGMPPMSELELHSVQRPIKRARRVSIGDEVDSLNSQEIQKLILTELEETIVTTE